MRLLEIYISIKYKEKALDILEAHNVKILSQPDIREDVCQIKGIMDAHGTEELLDTFEKHFDHTDDFKMILVPIKASLPREKKEARPEKETDLFTIAQRVSREELYAEISKNAKLSKFFISMIILSSFVAGIGLLKNNAAVIIGAMVIAPLLGPCVAFSFGATLGDTKLMNNSIRALIAGVVITIIITFLWGSFVHVDVSAPEIISRTYVGMSDIVLASSSGVAGVLSITVGASSVLVGVMVAVALMPPLVAVGLLLSASAHEMAAGAFLVFFTNIICITLSGIVTFFVQNVRPKTWWEADKAKKAIRTSVYILSVVLIILVILIYIQSKIL